MDLETHYALPWWLTRSGSTPSTPRPEPMKLPPLQTVIVVAGSVLLAIPALSRRPGMLAEVAPSAAVSPAAAGLPDAVPAAAPYQVGIASWYGSDFQGQETTSGEPFNMYGLTAAHRTLPLGTRVRVTNLLNQRSVVLRINDRGPVPRERVIDLSYAAARDLGFRAEGLVPVRIDLVVAENTQISANEAPALPRP